MSRGNSLALAHIQRGMKILHQLTTSTVVLSPCASLALSCVLLVSPWYLELLPTYDSRYHLLQLFKMAKVYVGGPEVGRSITKEDLEDKFTPFGRLLSVWVARQPPGFAFIGTTLLL